MSKEQHCIFWSIVDFLVRRGMSETLAEYEASRLVGAHVGQHGAGQF